MRLINVSAQVNVSGRRKRNEALYHHLLAASSAFSKGVFVNRAVPGDSGIEVIREDVVAGKRSIVVQPRVAVQETSPIAQWDAPQAIEQAGRSARWLSAELLAGDDYLLWMNDISDHAFYLSRHLAARARRRVFDISDDFSTWRWPREEARRRMEELAALADRLLCINDHMQRAFPHADSRVFHNGIEIEVYRENVAARSPLDAAKPSHAIDIGYVGGVIRERFNRPLLCALFERFPHARFIFVGYSNSADLMTLINETPHAFFVPEVPFAQLPSVIRSFDVAIIPHVVSEYTAGNDLLKVLDYLAAGVPVVSTPCSDIEARFGDVVAVAHSDEEFCTLVDHAVSRRHDARRGAEKAAALAWSSRIPELAAWVS